MDHEQFYFVCGEAIRFSDIDEFVSEIMLSEIYEAVDFDDQKQVDDIADNLRKIYNVVNGNISEMRKSTGMSQAQFARRFCIPLKNIKNWEQNIYNAPIYVKLLIAENLNLINR